VSFLHSTVFQGIVELKIRCLEGGGMMKYTKKRSERKNQKQRDATFEKFKKQQNELNANRRGVRRK